MIFNCNEKQPRRRLWQRVMEHTVVAASVLTLSACSIFSDEEITYAELQPISAEVAPEVVWRESVGDGVGEFFSRLNPVLSGDLLIAADRDGIFKALNKDTGKQVWRLNLNRDESGWSRAGGHRSLRISGGLVESRGRIYFGTENAQIGALDAETGELIWQQKVAGEAMADPAVGGGMVVVHTGAGNLVGLDAETGTQAWIVEQEVPTLTLRGASAPTLANGGAIYGTNNGKLMVIIMQNGQQAWEARVGTATGSSELERMVDVDAKPIIFDETIYTIALNGDLTAVELSSGRVIWQRSYSSFQNLAVNALAIYVTDADSHIHAVERRSGTQIWTSNELYGRQLTAPVVVGNYVVTADFEGYVHWFNRSSGVLEGRLELDGDGAYSTPVVDGDHFYIQLRDGTVAKVKS